MKNLAKNWQLFLLLTLSVTAVVFFIAIVKKPSVTSQVTIQVLCRNYNGKEFCQPEISNYLAKSVQKIVTSQNFIAGLIDESTENTSSIPKAQKLISVEKEKDLAILQIKVQHQNSEFSQQLLNKILENLANDLGKKYFKNTENISVEIIDGPMTVQTPVGKVVGYSLLIGLAIGLLVSVLVGWFLSKKDSAKESQMKWMGRNIQEQLSKKPTRIYSGLEKLKDIYPIEKKVIQKEEQPIVKQEINEKVTPEAKSEAKPAMVEEKVTLLSKNDEEPKKEEKQPEIPVFKSSFNQAEKKSAIPDNLPFMDAQQEEFKTPVEQPKEKSLPKDEMKAEEKIEKLAAKEPAALNPTEEEIKQRLNKLLKGEL